MQEERLTVIGMIQNDRISAVDGKRLLEVLANDDEKLNVAGYRDLRLAALLWLDRRQINAAQAQEILQLINNIAQKHDIEITEQELALLLKMRDEGTMEARTTIDLLKTLNALFDYDKQNHRKAERLQILNLVHKGKLTGSTAIELLQAFNPNAPKEAVPPRPIVPPVAPARESRPARPMRPESLPSRPRAAQGPSPEINRSYDVHAFIQQQVQQTLEAGRRGSMPAQASTSIPPVMAKAAQPVRKSLLDPLMDRLHDFLREAELTSKAVEQNWFALNQTPTPIDFDDLMRRMQASMATIHQKLAQVSEAKAALELHLNTVDDSERAIALELLDHTTRHYQKYSNRLKELEAGVTELTTVGQIRHEQEIRDLNETPKMNLNN